MNQFKLFKEKFPKISNFVFGKKEHQNSGTLGKDTKIIGLFTHSNLPLQTI